MHAARRISQEGNPGQDRVRGRQEPRIPRHQPAGAHPRARHPQEADRDDGGRDGGGANGGEHLTRT